MIKISNLNKYYGNTQILSDVNIHMQKGEIFGIIGHSGAGKSTLLRCINRLETYEDGSILVEDKEVKDLSENELRFLRKDLGMIFQHFSLLERKTVFENVAFALEIYGLKESEVRKRTIKAIEQVGLKDKLRSYPDELSGGEQQRVSIARAIVNDPKVLICDEPTGNLDPETSMEIMKVIDDINKELGTTIIMATHAKDIVNKMKKRVVTLDKGLIIKDTMKGNYISESD